VIALLVTAQALAAIVLGVVGLFPRLQRRGGGLNRYGYRLLGFGAAVFVTATVAIQVTNDAEAGHKQRRTERLLDRLFSVTAELVMMTPRGSSIPVAATTGTPITITSPHDDSEVDQRHFIQGMVSAPDKDVWVVVHPLDTSSYWVQPRVSVRSDGTWRVVAYFGRSGDLDKGKKFEVVAIGSPREALQEGEYGSTWPDAHWTSSPVVVIRR
jgi:hypothetical protein